MADHTIAATFTINQYTINATAGPNGAISPSGITTVNYGGSQAYNITPDTGYHVLDVVVDSVSQGPLTNYTFTNVVTNHTIAATFRMTPPVANFTATPLSGGVPLTVTFTDLSTNNPTSWLWNFGELDNGTSVLQNPTHTYFLPGNYSVELTATNEGGSNKSVRQGYIFTYYPAVANFTGTPTTGSYGLSGLTVQFSDHSTGGVSSWNWDFGDGSYSGANTQQNPGHTYAVGRYSVNLTVANTFSSSYLLRENYINVTPNAPTSDFETYDNDVDMNPRNSGVAPLSVFFYDLSSDDPTSWTWNFGDGNVTTITKDVSHEYGDIYHTFTNPGTYNVSLTANNAWGSDTSYKTITVFQAVTVTSVSPAAGPTAGGTPVTIIGTNLVGASAATFGGTTATGVSVINATAVSAITPAHAAGSVNVVVTTPNGTATGTNVYRYVSPPTITGISPTPGPLVGGTAVTITGTNLADAVVMFGSNPATVTTPGTTSIIVTSPAGSAAGAVTVTVTTPGGSATTTYRYYVIQVFTSSTTWAVPANIGTVEYLVVAGGGGGGGQGGGGGAGGVLNGTLTTGLSGTKTVTIGSGGTGGTTARASNGENSVFDTITATGGGGGGTSSSTSSVATGANGGSGGGGARNRAGGTASAGQGYNGGAGGSSTSPYESGGGGGKSAAGGAGSTANVGGAGGAGMDYSSIFGTGFGVDGVVGGGG
ncbi:PKD domain-containing protein, partial [Methanoregula sp.]|uniref:PKD domain-containing protein n=1 Tax=Methanoregula sp. TaxID=2052170 RepID=UPI000CBF8F33